MINVSNDFKTRTKRIKQQNIKLGIVDGELTVKEVHFMPVKQFNALPVWMLRSRKKVIAKELKYSFEGNLFKTIMKQIEITVKNAGELKDKNVNFQYGIYTNNDFEYIDLGDYYIKDVDDDKGKKELVVTGYDKMIHFMKTFKQSELQLTYPCRMLALIQKMCEVCGVGLYSTNFFNADLQVDEDYFTAQELTYRDVLEKIAETTETIIFIKDNKLYLHKLTNSPVEKLDASYLAELTVKEKFGPVNALVLGRGEVEDNIEAKDDTNISKNGRCEIRFDENEFIEYQRKTVIDRMFEKIKGLEYYAFEGSDIGVMWLEPGDLIEVEDTEQSKYKTIYLKANIIINTGINSDIGADIPTETNTEYKVTTKEEKKTLKVQRLAKKNEGLIQDIIEEQTDFSNKLTEHSQDIDSITDEVKKIYEFDKTVIGANELILEDALPTNVLRFEAKAKTVKGIYPSNKLFPSIKLFPKKGGTTITVVIGRTSRLVSPEPILPSKKLFPSKRLFPRSNGYYKREYEFYISKPLRNFNGVNDKFVIEIDEGKGICIAKVLRYIKYENGIMTLYDEPKEEIVKETNIMLYKGTNYIYIKEFTDWEIQATYIFNNELNKEYAPRVETNSKIKQVSDEINLEVSKKVNQDEVIASINLSPEQIKILAKNLQLEGFTSINGNFTIDEKGNMTCNDAKINGAVIANGEKFSIDEEGNMTCKSATMENVICENFTIKNSTIQEGFIELKSTNGNSSFSVTDTTTDRLNSELSASLLNFNSNSGRNVAQIGVDMASGNGFVSVTGVAECSNLVQTSQKEKKKYIKKVDKKALDVINGADIYQYQLRGEKPTGHRHYGLVIGENYNCPSEVKAENGKGIEIYSMLTLAWKAIQELSEQSKEQELIIKELQGGNKNGS